MDDDSGKQDQAPVTSRGPKLRPYQLSPAEQEVRDEREALERRERLEHLRIEAEGQKYKPKHRFLRFLGWMLLIVVLTAVGAGAAWWFWLRKEADPKPATNQQNTTVQTTTNDITATTKHHTSTNFRLEIDHPENWIVTDDTAKLAIVSPVMKLKDATDKSQNGQITLTIQNKQSTLSAFKSGNAVAVRASEKIAYAKPSPTQRGNSYLSFLNYADSTAKGLDGVYVTGDNGYQKDQAIPLVDIAKGDPLITITFTTCSDSKCSTAAGKPLTIAPAAWDDPKFANPLKAILQSIVVD